MKGKNIVLTVGLLAVCAGAAMAAPKLVSATAPQRVDPVSVTPEYFIDGVWVEGPTVPYASEDPAAYPNRILAFDGGYAVDVGATWAPGGHPCSGFGYWFVGNTDTTAPNTDTVRNAHIVNDFAGMPAAAVGQRLKGMFWLWHQPTDQPTPRVRMRWYDQVNTANSTNFTGANPFFAPACPNVLGAALYGVTFTYGAITAGNWYSNFDNETFFNASPAFTDTAGGFQMLFYSTGAAPDVIAADVQFYMQGVDGTAARPGTSLPLAWIDDSGEIGRTNATHAYDINAAVANSAFQITGTAATGNESYAITDPACFVSGLGPAVSFWIAGCTAVEAPTLNSPANGATGLTNPVTFEFTPPATLPVDFKLDIKQNNVVIHTMNNQNTASIQLDINLDDGETYGWSITSNAGGNCPGAESETWTFTMAGDPPCAADFNGDDIVDFFDYLDFVDAFSNNDPSADFNGDLIIDFFDYLDFVDAFSNGCP